MIFDQKQIDELKEVSPGLSKFEDGGRTYFLLRDYPLPIGCIPARMDLLFCPNPPGYESLVYFSSRPTGKGNHLNWAFTIHLLARNWTAFSWRASSTGTLIQMLHNQLNALK